MKRDNLLFFIEQIVDLNIANQSLCDERKENEARIKELEAHEIKPWSNDKRILETLQENIKLKERIKELEEQVQSMLDNYGN